MSVEIPSDLIHRIQTTLRKNAGIPSSSSDASTSFGDAISTLDADAPSTLRCNKCRRGAGLIRGGLSTLCIFCGHDLRKDGLTQSISFSSTVACKKLLESLKLDGTVFTLDKAGHAIRRLRAHSRPVRVVRYPRILDKLHLFSAGDDALLTYWDVPWETQLLTIPGARKDYIRAGSTSPVSSEVIATGSYDHSIKVWDVRVSNNSSQVLDFDHGDPVESVLFLPSGGLIATAGGNGDKIWDVVGGGRLIHTMDSHNKTVTSMCLGRIGNENSGESRILSVSIDGYLKSFDHASFKVTHSMRYPAQLLSVGFSPAGSARVVGTSNGTVYIGKKKNKDNEEMEINADGEFGGFPLKPQENVLRPTDFRYFRRGQNEKPIQSDFVVKRPAKVKLAEHDKLLKKFWHKDAFVRAPKKPRSIVAVMEELVARMKLLKCVATLDFDDLGLLLGFLHRYATMPRYQGF